MHRLIPYFSFVLLAYGTASAQNATVAGKFIVEHPTLLNLGFEWGIEGDANRNAEVAVQFRVVGESSWRPALPLVRIGGERIYRAREHLDYIVPNGFAGSILNLQPGTEYECRFQMSDPDGVSGEAKQRVIVKTRTEPQSYAGGRTLHIYPPDYEGPRDEPSFTGILQAYYGAGLGDWSVVWEQRAPTRRYTATACRTLSRGAARLRGPDDDAFRRFHVAHPQGHSGKAYHDQGRRRRRSGDRRRRQPPPFRCYGLPLSHL